MCKHEVDTKPEHIHCINTSIPVQRYTLFVIYQKEKRRKKKRESKKESLHCFWPSFFKVSFPYVTLCEAAICFNFCSVRVSMCACVCKRGVDTKPEYIQKLTYRDTRCYLPSERKEERKKKRERDRIG